MPETIFRRLEKSETKDEDYLKKVEALKQMNSSDSSHTGGTRTTVSERTDRSSKLPDLILEEGEQQQDRPSMTTGEENTSGSDRTDLTSPVTPDTSVDGGTEGSPPLEKLAEEQPTMTASGQATNDDEADKDGGLYDGDREEERDLKTPSPVQTTTTAASFSTATNTTGTPKATHRRQSSYSSGTEPQRNRATRRSRTRSLRDDESSSDDDSSYFATHLPDPKSGRSFSVSSTNSNASAFSQQYQLQKQGSDASLSFSDESDEDHHHVSRHQIGGAGVHLSPVVNPHGTVAEMNLYPQRITRMHSVSSLVSSASSDNPMPQEDDSADEDGPNRRRSFTGDNDSVTSSLPSIASTGPEAMRLDGGIGYYGHGAAAQASAVHHGYHPQSYLPQQGMQFYSQHPMTNQQLMAWANAPPSDGEFEYTSSDYTTSTRNPSQQRSALATRGGSGALKSASSSSLNFAYSDDDDLRALFSSSAKMGKQAADFQGMGGSRNGRVGFDGNSLSDSNGRLGGVGGSQQKGGVGGPDSGSVSAVANGSSDNIAAAPGGAELSGRQTFKIYWQRWIMLFYMSVLNLLSDWTCYSVAPISLLTEEAFGSIDPERLVVVFLGANAIATACEPMLLARLGLRRTVLFGALLLMIGSCVKSGGLPPITESTLEVGKSQWSLYLGFFIVGLSQPLYQCTPALLSASWFPEEERTMATGVALNANQLGIGFAFIAGTLLVTDVEDIFPYFGLLSQISTLCFIGTLIQFDDAPPTPPSASARVMKGNLNFRIPGFADERFARYFNREDSKSNNNAGGKEKKKASAAQAPTPASMNDRESKKKSKRNASKGKKASRSTAVTNGKRTSARRRGNGAKFQTANAENGLSASVLAPSSAHYGSTAEARKEISRVKAEAEASRIPSSHAPSPAPADTEGGDLGGGGGDEFNPDAPPGVPGQPMAYPPGQMPGYYGYNPYAPPPPPDFQYFQQMQQQAYFQQMYYQQQQQQQQQQQPSAGAMGQAPPPPMMSPGMPPPPQMQYFPPPMQQMAMPYSYQQQFYPPMPPMNRSGGSYHSDAYDIDAFGDDGAEPTVTVTDHHLDINIRDDQVVRSLHACMIRQGFSHALAAFTVSGIVINTLSTYMDYLVRLNGAPRSYTGIVGGTFQFAIMCSSLIVGKQTDNTRAYYSVTTGMLVLGAFGLAECGVSLDSNRGGDLRWSLLLVAVLVGPLQPISTELGVEVAYPLSENTVLVIQQLFSNLLSAIFIPFFKSLKDIGTSVVVRGGETIERPEFTFSFYLLIVLHTLVTVYFATFNGRYLRYEHELQKKEDEDAAEAAAMADAEDARRGEYSSLLNSPGDKTNNSTAFR